MYNMNTRIYSDILYASTNMYTPFFPSRQRIGDFGYINARDGEFVRSGNLFDRFPSLPDTVGQFDEIIEDQRIFQGSEREKGWEAVDVSNMPEFAHAKVKAGWDYKQGVFAALVPSDPIYTSIRYLGNLGRFLQELQCKEPNNRFLAFLQDKILVTSVVQCTSYARFFTSGNEGTTYAAFFDGAGPEGKVGWVLRGVSGQSAIGKYERGKWMYTPMAGLRSVQEVMRMGRCLAVCQPGCQDEMTGMGAGERRRESKCDCGGKCDDGRGARDGSECVNSGDGKEGGGDESASFVPSLETVTEEDEKRV